MKVIIYMAKHMHISTNMHCTSWELTACPLMASGKGTSSSQLPMGLAMRHFSGGKSPFWGNQLLQSDPIMRFRLPSIMLFFPWKVQNSKRKHQSNAFRVEVNAT